MRNMIIVDNCATAFMNQLDNGIPVSTFVGNPDDSELIYIAGILQKLSVEMDVRVKLAQTFFMRQLYKLHRDNSGSLK